MALNYCTYSGRAREQHVHPKHPGIRSVCSTMKPLHSQSACNKMILVPAQFWRSLQNKVTSVCDRKRNFKLIPFRSLSQVTSHDGVQLSILNFLFCRLPKIAFNISRTHQCKNTILTQISLKVSKSITSLINMPTC